MDIKEQVNGWLISLGNRSGKHFRLIDGVFAAKDEDGQEYVIEIPESSEQLYFCAPIAALHEDGEKTSDFECLMKWNLYGLKTFGGTLSYEESTNRIIFHYIVRVDTLDENSFCDTFNRFIAMVRDVQKMWLEYSQTKVNTSQQIDDFNMMMRV